MRTHEASFLCGLLFCVVPAICVAGVGDPTIRTDHEHYAGEGAFQSIDECVKFATASVTNANEQDRALAMFNWLLTHQFHLHSPQQWNIPGLVPGQTSHPDMSVYDANRSRFSFGYGLCGNVHAWNEPYWKSLGMTPRRRAFPGHTNGEIKYGGSWHAFDTDMAGLVFRDDGVVAGYEDIAKNPAMVKPNANGVPCYPFAWPSDFNGMKKGWQQIANGGKWYAMYNGGYAAHPPVVHLRSGETFTRWFDRDHFGGPTKRRFWHKQKNGPYRDWTFVNNGDPWHKGEKSNSRGNASYCNGEFIYSPDLAGGFAEGVAQRSSNLASRDTSPKLFSSNGKPAAVTFTHFSPYVICGDPVDDIDPMSGPASGGLVVAGKATGDVRIEVAPAAGQTWHDVGTVTGDFERDLTDLVKGRYGWHVRFQWSGTAGLDQLRFTTVTQVSQMIYPRLTANGSAVTYRSASRAVTPVLPALELPESEQTYEVKAMRSDNVRFTPRSQNSRYVYQTTNNKPASIVYRVAAPARLREVVAAARYGIRVPPPAEAEYRLEISTDEGKTWAAFAESEIPVDNEYSSGWLAGSSPIADEVTSALVRVHFYAGGYTTGIIETEFYAVHETGNPQAVELTYGWLEGGKSRSHIEAIEAGADSHEFEVATGAEIVDEFIRLAAP